MIQEKVTILGLGQLGRALAHVLEDKKEWCKTCGWDIVATGDPHQIENIEEALLESTVLFIAIPSTQLDRGIKNLKEGGIARETVIISCTKGLGAATKKLPFELLTNSFPRNHIGVLSGPMLAHELHARRPTKATLAGYDGAPLEKVKELFAGTALSLELSCDPRGVSIVGILKNIYAVALGLADGLGYGSNYKACLALQALQEMKIILQKEKGKEETLMTPAGIADFLATGYSTASRNYSYGFEYAQGRIGNYLAEGVINIVPMCERAGDLKKTPLLSGLKRILQEKTPPQEVLTDFFV